MPTHLLKVRQQPAHLIAFGCRELHAIASTLYLWFWCIDESSGLPFQRLGCQMAKPI